MTAREVSCRGVVAVALGLAWLLMLPLPPVVAHDTLDASWIQALHVATESRLTFGSEIVFTYGPLGFVHARTYWPGLFILTFVFWALLGAGLLDAWRTVTRGSLPATAFAAAMLVVAASFGGLFSFDALVFGYLLLWAWQVEAGGTGRVRLAAHGALVGMLALSKLTFGLAGMLVAVMVATILVVRRQASGAWVAPAAATLLFVVGWIAIGQPLGALPEYVTHGMQIVLGYGEAMALRGPRWEMTAYAVLVAVTVAATAWHAVARRDAGTLAATVASLALAALAWKQGFIRQDEHVFVAFVFSTLAASALAAREGPTSRVRAGVLALASLASVSCTFASMEMRSAAQARLAIAHLVQRPAWIVRSIPGWWDGHWRAAHEASLGRIREATPLPKLPGTVDIYSHGQALVFAHGLRWQPRPVFQSYSAYTPALVEMNRRHLMGPRAPEHLLVAIEPIDKRLPALEDGASWLPMLERYSLREEGRYLVLDRAREPQRVARRPLPPVEAKGWAPLPAEGALVLASLTLLDSPRGMGQALRGPRLYEIQVRLQGDPIARAFRFIRGGAEVPFVLSPLVESNHELAQLFHPCEGDGRRVTAVRILGDKGREVPFRMALEVVDALPRARNAGGLRQLVCDLRSTSTAAPFSPPIMVDRGNRGLNVHPPSRWRVARPARAIEVCTRLAARGLEPDGSDGYELRVVHDGKVVAERIVRPEDVQGGREACVAARFAAPAADVELRVDAGGHERWDWVYVTRMTLDE